jgi:hypothetical protein
MLAWLLSAANDAKVEVPFYKVKNIYLNLYFNPYDELAEHLCATLREIHHLILLD